MDSNESSEIPESPSWLTREYITEALRRGEDDPDITVDNLEINTSLAKGENYATLVYRITVTYTDGKGKWVKKPFVIKSTHLNSLMLQFAKEAHLFEKELCAYSKLIPAMSSLTEKPLVSPKFYPTDRDDVVILEDLTPRGFKMADRKKRLDLSHSILALKTLARFHGLSVAVLQKEPSIVDHFPESMYTERTREMNSKFLPNMYHTIASVIERWPGYERFAEKIRVRIEGIVEELETIIVPKEDEFNVLNHGDFWVNNMLFRYNKDTQEVEEVCLIDLQIIRYGSPALDLHYFFAASLADGIREEYEDMLLEVYHKALAETLKSLDIDCIKYSLEDLKKDFQEKGIFGFYMTCLLLGFVTADSSEAFDIENITEESMNDEMSNMGEKTFQGKIYKGALQKYLVFFEDRGVI